MLKPWQLKVSYSRRTLGVEANRPERCNVCGTHEKVNRINIDGIWSYLCDDDFQTLWMLHMGEDVASRVEVKA